MANPECQDVNGCIELHAHPSLREDEELYRLLLQVIRNPCAFIPMDRRFHWVSLFYSNWVSYESLNCGKGQLPYSRAFISFGDTRVEVEL